MPVIGEPHFQLDFDRACYRLQNQRPISKPTLGTPPKLAYHSGMIQTLCDSQELDHTQLEDCL